MFRTPVTCCRQSRVYLDESITDMQASVGRGTSAQDYCPLQKDIAAFHADSFHLEEFSLDLTGQEHTVLGSDISLHLSYFSIVDILRVSVFEFIF